MQVSLIALVLVLSSGVGDPVPPPGSAELTLEAGQSFVCQSWEDSNEPIHWSFLLSPEFEQVSTPRASVSCSWRNCRPPFDQSCFAMVEDYCAEEYPNGGNDHQQCVCFNTIPECCGGAAPNW